MHVLSLSVLALASLASGEYVVKTFGFYGGVPSCTQCGAAGSYACSANDIGNWNNGTVSFYDPLPAGVILTEVQATLSGSFGCDGSPTPATVRITLQGAVIDIQNTPLSPTLCQCNQCDNPVTFTQRYLGGFPNYSYGRSNVAKVDVLNNFICISSLTLNMTYSKPVPVNTWYTSYTPFSGADPNCAACGDFGQFYCFNRNSYVFTFTDPLPAHALLLGARVELYGKYFCSDPRGASTHSTIGVYLQSTLIESRALQTSSAKCDCLTCDGGALFASSNTYQAGWPQYAYGGDNKLSIAAVDDQICLSRFDVQFTYYSRTLGEVRSLRANLSAVPEVA